MHGCLRQNDRPHGNGLLSSLKNESTRGINVICEQREKIVETVQRQCTQTISPVVSKSVILERDSNWMELYTVRPAQFLSKILLR